MSLGSEELSWAGLPRNGYRFTRRAFGWGSTKPSSWLVGGWFYDTFEETLNQNIGTKDVPKWETKASTEEAAIGVIIALGG